MISPQEKKRVQLAYDYFIKSLSLSGEPITLKYKVLDTKDNAAVAVSRNPDGSYKSFTVYVNEKEDFSLDNKIIAVAHELIHVQQLTTGKLDIQKKTWDGKVIDQENYWHQPWESNARVESRRLWVEFNRGMRDKATEKDKPIKLSELWNNAFS